MRVTAAGIYGADLSQLRGFYPAPPGSPADVPGLELAGEVADAGPFDVVLELVGAPNFPVDLDVLADGGRIMVIGAGAGARAELDLRRLMTARGRVLASHLRGRSLEQKADAARRVEAQALPLVAAGRLRIPVEATFPLEAAQEAYDRFAAGGKLGKVVLTAG